MASSIRSTIARNAVANVARGMAAALVALAVPPFLTRALPPAKYGAWSLVLQLAAYVAYLEFGVHTAVGRLVAHGNERCDFEHRDKVINTALALLAGACVLAMALIVILIVFLPEFFRKMPVSLYHDVRIALLLIGGSLAIGLPASVVNGIFFGLQRYGALALVIGSSRILSGVLIVCLARSGGQIPAMALSMAAVNLFSYAVLWFLARRYAPDIHISPGLISRKAGRELAVECMGLTVWSFSMLLISGLDLTLVGIFDFQNLPYYAVAATLVTFAAGAQNSMFAATVPSTAVLHARGDQWRLGRMVIDGTRYGMVLLLVTGLPLLLATKPILHLWVGAAYAVRTAIFLQILVTANILRLSGVPYAMALVGTGQQRLVILTPIFEGLTNLSISVVAGYYWGAVGIAFGTLCGAFVVIAGNLFYNMPRTTELRFSIHEYVFSSILRPTLCVLPLLSAFFLVEHSALDFQGSIRVFTLLLAGLTSVWCLWRWGLVGSDRQRILRFGRSSLMLSKAAIRVV
jgi:O-antigen/teichoic acid export membrane protein